MRIKVHVAPPEAILFCAVKGVKEETIVPLALLSREIQESLEKESFKELSNVKLPNYEKNIKRIKNLLPKSSGVV